MVLLPSYLSKLSSFYQIIKYLTKFLQLFYKYHIVIFNVLHYDFLSFSDSEIIQSIKKNIEKEKHL